MSAPSQLLDWSPERICLAGSPDVEALAAEVYRSTCRTDFSAPGFCLVNLGSALDSSAFRRQMVELKRAMAALHAAATGDSLIYLSAARFDQQTTTKPHLDGGPEECFLILGYEPSEVDAELEIADYAKCAFDLGLTPGEFMAQHNPMFQAGYELLRPYMTRIPCFSPVNYQIVCINNSSARYSPERPAWQGTLHTATIRTPDESKRRVVNSTMIARAPAGTSDALSELELDDFVSTSLVRRRGYDKPYLDEDR